MADRVTTTVRLDPGVRDEAKAVLDELGLGLGVGIEVFLRAVVRERGIPFPVHLGERKDSANGEEPHL